MSHEVSKEEAKWTETVQTFGRNASLNFGPYLTFIIRNSPRRLLHMMSYYKFAAKMIGKADNVLEVGCSEGFGSILLGEFSSHYHGIDIEKPAIECAIQNFRSEKVSFEHGDFLNNNNDRQKYNGVVSLDVIEHIYPENEDNFIRRISEALKSTGIAIIGTPNIYSDQFASPVTKVGHVNLFTGERLQSLMGRYFGKVLLFSANDEVVHTGFSPMAHYLICVGIKTE